MIHSFHKFNIYYRSIALIIGGLLFTPNVSAINPYEKPFSSSRESVAKSNIKEAVAHLTDPDKRNFEEAINLTDKTRRILHLGENNYRILGGAIQFQKEIPFYDVFSKIPGSTLTISLQKVSPEAGRYVTDTFKKYGLFLAQRENGTILINDGSIEDRNNIYADLYRLKANEYLRVTAIEMPSTLSNEGNAVLRQYGFDLDSAVKTYLPVKNYDVATKKGLDRPWLESDPLNPYTQKEPAGLPADHFSVSEAYKVLEEKRN